MQFFPNMKDVVVFGNIRITWYAVLILTGAMLAYWLSIRTLKKWGYKKDIFEDFFFYMLPIGIIGARLYYVIFEWQAQQYALDPIRIFYIWEGGLAIHGGLIAAIGFGLWYFSKRCVDGMRIMDAIFPNILLAQAIGRWGNFMNQEAYGGIVSADYYTNFPAFIRDRMFIHGECRQPTFLFESVGNLLGFILITTLYNKYGRKKRGDLAFAYLSWYGLVRFIVEGMRTDSLMLGNLRVAQIVSLVSVGIGILGILGVWDRLFKNIWPFKRKKPVILFDLDGTLVDTEDLIFASFVHTFKKYKPEYTLSEAELKSFLGPTLRQTFERYFDSSQCDEMIAYYRDYNHKHHDELIKEYPGAKETLAWLKDNGYDVGVVSNKVEKTVRMGLKTFGLESYVQVVVGAEGVDQPKPSPEGLLIACEKMYHGHDDIIYIGDSPSDIKTCKNMGAFSIAAAFDKSRASALEKEKPCAIIHRLSEVIDIVKEDREWSDVTI